MITFCLARQAVGAATPDAHLYHLAARTVASDVALAELAAFCAPAPLPPTPGASSSTGAWPDRPERERLVYRGQGWVGGRMRDVVCQASASGYRLAVAGAAGFAVAPDGTRVTPLGERWSGATSGPTPDPAVDVLLGPALILALALQDTWCLHASAALCGGRAVAFVGPSGSGKSTLARFLTPLPPLLADPPGAGEQGGGEQEGEVWQRLADDVLPIGLSSSGPAVRPHFPQLKLRPAEQPARGMPQQVPLAAIYMLAAPVPERHAAEVRAVATERLGTHAAALALVRHTVAARLFDRDVLARHLRFCTEVAAHIPVRRLSYAHVYDVLPQVRHTLELDLC